MVLSMLTMPQPAAPTRRRFLKQDHGVGALELRVGVREVAADVAQTGGTQQGVGDGMQQRIRVGMPEQPVAVGNGDATKDQGTAGDEGMGVPSLSDTQGWRCHGCARLR